MTSWTPVPFGVANDPSPRVRLARRGLAVAVAAVASLVLLVPLLDALRPERATAILDRYARDPRPATVRVAEGRFVAAFPDPPSRSTHTGGFDGKAVQGASYESDPVAGYRFLVTYLDLPAAAAGRDREVLAAALASSARSFGGTLVSHTDITFDGNPGAELVVRVGAGAFRGRVTLVGTRLYVYGVQTPAANTSLFTKFASSFALVAD